jgi:hypothetical protein
MDALPPPLVPITVRSLFDDAVGLFGLTAPVIISVMLTFAVLPNFIVTMIMEKSKALDAWIFGPLLVLNIIATAATFACILHVGNGQLMTMGQALRRGVDEMAGFAVLLILSIFLVGFGVLLFILPGLVLNIVSYLAFCVRINEHRPVSDTLQRAWAIFRVSPKPLFIFMTALLIPQFCIYAFSLYPPDLFKAANGELTLGLKIVGDILITCFSIPATLGVCAYYLRVTGTKPQQTARIFE